MTTQPWLDGLVGIDDGDWVGGGTPAGNRIFLWCVQSIGHDDIDFWQGRLHYSTVETAIEALVKELVAENELL